MTKAQILYQLKNDIYTRLAPMKHGIGVVAIRHIPKGVDPFLGTEVDEWIPSRSDRV